MERDQLDERIPEREVYGEVSLEFADRNRLRDSLPRIDHAFLLDHEKWYYGF